MFKVIIFCAFVAVAHGGIAHLRSLGLVESASALQVETVPSITKIEELAPSVSSHFRTEVINAPITKIEHVASPVISAAYKTDLVAAPAVAKVEHIIPSAQSLFKGELVSAASFPSTISRVEHLAPAISTHKIISTPSVSYETALPAISRFEHLSPSIATHKTEFITSPSLKYEVASPVHVAHVSSPSFARVEHLAPALSTFKTDFVSAPVAKTFLDHGFVLH
ncbi:hypothetical protein RN001_015287 [Aquatica leii]|uniref:Cuticle protein n=1 Tax=Aquatica leii TaxID=1421715 RepID=A0AAN7QCG6_9COLE|nr:hypothetical protein RN001_015287 [Aquatica leii]